MMFLFVILLIAGLWLLFGPARGPWAHGGCHGDRHHYPYGDPALDLLRRRYASGEITAEQYEEMKARLQNLPQ